MRLPKISAGMLILVFSALLPAQPPAQGPPPASANAPSWPVFSFNNLVKAQVDATVNSINASLAARGDVRASISQHVSSWSPIPLQTQYPDQPNSKYLDIPYILSFDVNNIQYKAAGVWLSYPWSRNISISMDLSVFCKGWQTGNGTITLVTQGQPPYLDQDHALSEQIVDQFLGGWLISYVDSQVMSSVAGVTSGSTDFGFPCRSLGAYYGDPNTVSDDAILWDKPTGLQLFLTAFNSVTVRPASIKRLAAHALDGSVLYQAVESPMLEFWANFGTWDYQLPSMVENQQVALPGPNITVPAPAAGNSLVIIASTAQTNGTKDSAWETFTSATNYGSGTQTIVISKVYWQPPHYPITKPTKILVPAYEITFQVTGPATTSVLGSFTLSP
jgi:hypothetical protein